MVFFTSHTRRQDSASLSYNKKAAVLLDIPPRSHHIGAITHIAGAANIFLPEAATPRRNTRHSRQPTSAEPSLSGQLVVVSPQCIPWGDVGSGRRPLVPHNTLSQRESPRGGGTRALKQACSCPNRSAMCVQQFDDSLSSAIRITFRISLRSSSLREPRHPLLKVVLVLL